jgi:hypothetical protein
MLHQALAIDPKLPAAHIALGKVRYFFDFDWPAAQAEFASARTLDPRDPSSPRCTRCAASRIKLSAGSTVHISSARCVWFLTVDRSPIPISTICGTIRDSRHF